MLLQQPYQAFFISYFEWSLKEESTFGSLFQFWVFNQSLRQEPLQWRNKCQSSSSEANLNPTETVSVLTCLTFDPTSSWFVSSKISSRVSGWSSPSWCLCFMCLTIFARTPNLYCELPDMVLKLKQYHDISKQILSTIIRGRNKDIRLTWHLAEELGKVLGMEMVWTFSWPHLWRLILVLCASFQCCTGYDNITQAAIFTHEKPSQYAR